MFSVISWTVICASEPDPHSQHHVSRPDPPGADPPGPRPLSQGHGGLLGVRLSQGLRGARGAGLQVERPGPQAGGGRL